MGSDMTQKCAPPRVCLRERVFSSPITLAADTTAPCTLFLSNCSPSEARLFIPRTCGLKE